MQAVPVTPRQVMFTVCGQCPSLHAEGLMLFSKFVGLGLAIIKLVSSAYKIVLELSFVICGRSLM